MTLATQGIKSLAEHVDSLIVIPNDRLRALDEKKKSIAEAFAQADEVLLQGVKSISELIKVPGFINLDFADVTSVMKDAGYAHMGVGRAKGKDKAETAANMAVSSPLLETSIAGAKGVIISFTASQDVDLEDIEKAAEIITDSAHEDANITWGIAFDPDLDDELVITVIATGFDSVPADYAVKEARPVQKQVNPFYVKAPAQPEIPAAPSARVSEIVEPVIPSKAASNDIVSSSAPVVPGKKAEFERAVEKKEDSGAFNDDQFYVMINDIINK